MLSNRSRRKAPIPNAPELAVAPVAPPAARMFRQGDILLVRVESTPAGARELAHGVLALGEATGHAHHALAPAVQLEHGDTRYLRVPDGGADLVHEEHARIPLPPGFYQVVYQRVYAPMEVSRVD